MQELKSKLRDQDLKYALIFPCTLKVDHAGKTLFFRTPDEVETFLCELSSIDSSIDSELMFSSFFFFSLPSEELLCALPVIILPLDWQFLCLFFLL